MSLKSYLTCVESKCRRPKTLAKYRASFDCFEGYAFSRGITRLDQVSLLLVEEYRAVLRRRGYAATTLEHRASILKQLTRWAVERSLLQHDPLAGLKGKKVRPGPQPCFTPEQVETILSTAKGQQQSILEVLAFTGMRIGELVWLTRDDVDFEKGFIQIRPKDNWVPKHGRSRVIPMHDRVRKVLEKLPWKHRWVFAAKPSGKYPKGGHQISATHVLERLKKVLSKLGLQGHLHTFRHFFTSHCANNGVPPFQLIKWLGHADVGMVMHYYELHDEESLWTMKKLSMVEGHQPPSGKVETAVS